MKKGQFQEIGHCGGQYFIEIGKMENGQWGTSFGMSGSRPGPMSLFAIYSTDQGIPVETIQMGGIGDPWNAPPVSGCYPIFISSDTEGMFGHLCPRCKQYWRSKGAPSRWNMTCAYCGLRSKPHSFRTIGQRKYIAACCEHFNEALANGKEGKFVIDMDEVADAVGKETEKPKFYYAEESQQNRYKCNACGEHNDILGVYGYCSSCGTYNALQILHHKIEDIKKRILEEGRYSANVRDAVSEFDGFARSYAKQLVQRIPMTPRRAKRWGEQLFHNLRSCIDSLKGDFDIDMGKNIKDDDLNFLTLMFYRRHVYEHNAGEVTEKYLKDSGDMTVRLKQVINETQESAIKTAEGIIKLATNLHKGFHEIFSPEPTPIRLEEDEKKRRAAYTKPSLSTDEELHIARPTLTGV